MLAAAETEEGDHKDGVTLDEKLEDSHKAGQYI